MENNETIDCRNVDDPLISIVLPVYNVADFLRQSLDTVVDQTYENLEIICVDDGSTDESPVILEEYKKSDSRIQILHQENSGAAAARNNGMDHAKGKYIIFWDPDDYFELNAIKILVEKAEAEEADVCGCDAQTFYSDTGELIYHPYVLPPFPKNSPFSWRDCPDRLFFILSTVSWNKLVRLSMLRENDIRFFPIKYMEDNLYSFYVMRYAERISICRKRLIYYRANRPGSLVQTKDSTTFNAVTAYKSFYDEMNKRNLLDDDTLRDCFFRKTASMFHYRIRYNHSFSEYEKLFALNKTAESATADYDSGTISRIDKMRNLSAGDYLLDSYKILVHKENMTQQKLLESKEREVETRKKCDRLSETNRDLSVANQNLFEDNQNLSESNHQLKERIDQLEEIGSEQKERLRRYKSEMKRIRSSRSYRIGKFVTFIPRKLRQKFKNTISRIM